MRSHYVLYSDMMVHKTRPAMFCSQLRKYMLQPSNYPVCHNKLCPYTDIYGPQHHRTSNLHI